MFVCLFFVSINKIQNKSDASKTTTTTTEMTSLPVENSRKEMFTLTFATAAWRRGWQQDDAEQTGAAQWVERLATSGRRSSVAQLHTRTAQLVPGSLEKNVTPVSAEEFKFIITVTESNKKND